MVFCLRFFPRKLEKKVFSYPTMLKSKAFMIDIPLASVMVGASASEVAAQLLK